MPAFQGSLNPIENRLLATLPREEYERLLPYLETVSLTHKQVVYTPNEPIEYVYFPKNCVISLVIFMEDGLGVEVGTVGNEGMAGIPLFLGADRIPSDAFCQIPGDALRMRADVFKNTVTPGSPLHYLLQRYTQTLLNQIAQTAACNSVHLIEKRCCRWLLMTHDRVGTDEFALTQEYLSQMLGVRRASVSAVATALQDAGFISYSRGKIRILDRKGLESTACQCYRTVKAEFYRLLDGNRGAF